MSKSKPIVFARGIARFDILRDRLCTRFNLSPETAADELRYFRGMQGFLTSHGYRVHYASVGFADCVDERAWQLSREVRRIMAEEKAEQVHIIAHSMGGLDARHMIVDVPGMAERVAVLTTVGAPHLGTCLANRLLKWGGAALIERVYPYLHLDGFQDLTPEACAAFNQRARDREARNGVAYQVYGSAEEREAVFLPLQVCWTWVNKVEGENDGLVSLRSQLWCSELKTADGKVKKIEQKRFPFPADHFNQCGWWEPGEAKSSTRAAFEARIKGIYLEIARSGGGARQSE